MARTNKNLINRNHKLSKRFTELYGKKLKAKRLYSYEAVLAMLEDEFFLSSSYIAKLLNKKCTCEKCLKP